MAKVIPLENAELGCFIEKERDKVLAYLRKRYSLPDEDLEDIFQESSIALVQNIRSGKLSNLTSSLSTYFLGICINQTLKLLEKSKGSTPLIGDYEITNSGTFLQKKIDELYQLCTEDYDEEKVARSEKIVQNILKVMSEACKNIFQGYYWDNLSTATIADMYGFANADSVKTQKYKCLQKFRNKYNELMGKIYG